MTRKLEKDALLSDLASVNAMLASLPDDDLVGRVGFEARKEEIEAELTALEKARDTLANVALMFHGGPVRGSRAVDAEFAAKALETYQDLVAKRLATSETGGLAQRGPVPSRKAASLNISGVIHGSFGFVLEEDEQEAPQLVNSSLREAVDSVTSMLERFTDESDEVFLSTINEMDPRLFSSIKTFFAVLHGDEATLRIVEGETDRSFDAISVVRGYQRSQETSVEEEPVTLVGTLIGVVPYGRRFELKTSETEVIKGKVGPLFSQDYLERIENDEQVIGREWRAKLLKKSVDRPGRRTQFSYTLLDLELP